MSDDALVYDNQRHHVTHQDRFIQVCPGLAHISPEPFNAQGNWGWAWRPHREFVGRISYGVRFALFVPFSRAVSRFPLAFLEACRTLMMCHCRDNAATAFGSVPADVLLYVLNMCSHNWFNDPRAPVVVSSAFPAGVAGPVDDDSETDGIGWRSGNYRSLIEKHMRRSVGHPFY